LSAILGGGQPCPCILLSQPIFCGSDISSVHVLPFTDVINPTTAQIEVVTRVTSETIPEVDKFDRAKMQSKFLLIAKKWQMNWPITIYTSK